jgi:hypothetical protein
MRFLLGYLLGVASMTAAVGVAPTGAIEKMITHYSNVGYALAKELAGGIPGRK